MDILVSFRLSFVLFIEFAPLGQAVTILHFVRELGCRLPIQDMCLTWYVLCINYTVVTF